MLERIGVALLVVVALLAGWAFTLREEATRLLAVNSLFAEERIVDNFSNMNAMFLHAPVRSEGVRLFAGEAVPLPERVGGIDVETYLSGTATTSLLVLRDGRVVHEVYRLGTSPSDRRISWSMAKSVLSLAVGVAVRDGLVDLDRTVESYVPALAGSAYKGVTVRQALSMSSGVLFDEDYLDFWSDINRMGRTLALGGSMDAFAAARDERTREPGTVRQYNSIDTHVVAMVLRAATGRSLPDYLSEAVLQPAGVEDGGYYVTDGEGTAFALGGLNLTTRDYARIGLMVLREDGPMPREWIAVSTSAVAPPPAEPDGFGYGYQWWMPDGTRGVTLARGVYGQYLWIDRPRGVVIVKTSADRGFREPGASARDMEFLEALAASVSN